METAGNVLSTLKFAMACTVTLELQRFAFKHKPQTCSRICLHLKRRICHWEHECYTTANACTILGVTVMF